MIRALSELERDLTPPEYAFSCNQISEHSNIYQFQMWLMPSRIHFNCFQIQLPFPVLPSTLLIFHQIFLYWFPRTSPFFVSLKSTQNFLNMLWPSFKHVMAFYPPLTSFDSSGDFSNRLRSRSRQGILLGAGARTVKDKAFPAPKEVYM